MSVSRLLRLEGLAAFLASLLLFAQASGTWWIFILFFLAPDLSMLGYLANPRLGSVIYNLVHNYLLVILLFAVGSFVASDALRIASIILLGHIGMDRVLGFGLKYPTAFKDTHLQRV